MPHAKSSPRALDVAMVAVLAVVVGACAESPSKEAQEAAKNTFACQLAGERLVVRFDGDEARLLMSNGERIVLYQVPTGSGVRYTNGTFDLRGKGMDLQIIRNGNPTPLADCQPYVPPK
jgi:membrane-bound inhibitor of C-type lysozyme